jgi:hypothetical protein
VCEQLIATLHSNLAMCCLKLDDPERALVHCDAALGFDKTMLKVRACELRCWRAAWPRACPTAAVGSTLSCPRILNVARHGTVERRPWR